MKRQGIAGTEKSSWSYPCLLVTGLSPARHTGVSNTIVIILTDFLTCIIEMLQLYLRLFLEGITGLSFWFSFTVGDSTVSQLLCGDHERLLCGSRCASAEWWWIALILWWQQLHHLHEGGSGQVSDWGLVACHCINFSSYILIALGIFSRSAKVFIIVCMSIM